MGAILGGVLGGMQKSVFRFLSRHSDAVELENDNYLLRLPRYSDFNQWHKLRAESRRFLEPWEPTWRHDELTEAAYRARIIRGKQEYSSGQAIPLFIFLRENTTLVGGITIGYIRRGAAQSCMIGYWMGERYSGQGHMFAALQLVIPYIFSGLELHRIEAACIPDNERSMRLLQKAGFQREGHLRGYLKINGQWRDHVMFSRLASDTNPNRSFDQR
jgi:ribosomal-protein-alanine N-acetyltransferase